MSIFLNWFFKCCLWAFFVSNCRQKVSFLYLFFSFFRVFKYVVFNARFPAFQLNQVEARWYLTPWPTSVSNSWISFISDTSIWRQGSAFKQRTFTLFLSNHCMYNHTTVQRKLLPLKVCSFLEHSFAILGSFKIVIIFYNTWADFVLISADVFIENDNNFEWTEDYPTVFERWTDFANLSTNNEQSL